MQKKKLQALNDPVVDAMVWMFRFIKQVFELAQAIVLRKTVDLLKFINDLFPGKFTSNLFESYGDWYNSRLIHNALDCENKGKSPFKVIVEEVQTVNNYLISTIRYQNMTAKNIRMYISNGLCRELSVNRKAIQIHKIKDNRVRAILDLSA